jgi:hypothetical protein
MYNNPNSNFMKGTRTLVATLALGLLISSCTEKNDGNGNGPFQYVPTDNSPSNGIRTAANNDFSYWTSDFYNVTYVQASSGESSNWFVYLYDAGGSMQQVNNGDFNHWEGIMNYKDDISNGFRIDATIEDNPNEWKCVTTDNSQDIVRYVRTETADDMNHFKVYSNSNQLLYEMKTTTRNDFNNWKFTCANSVYIALDPCLFFMPVLISARESE